MSLRDEKKFAETDYTANATLNRNQSGQLITNKGASGAVTIKVPSGSQQGDFYDFAVIAAQAFNILPTDATDVFILSGTAGTANHGITSSTAGAQTTVKNIGGGQWLVTSATNWSTD